MKKHVSSILKFAIAGGIILYLVNSGKIDVRAVLNAFNNGTLIVFAFLILLVTFLMSVYRWQLILVSQGIHLPFWNIFKISFTGLFFNLAVPGLVGGDIAKSFYIFKNTTVKKSVAVATVFFDRVIGMFGLVLIGALMSALNWEFIAARPNLYIIVNLTLVLLAAFVVLFVSSFSKTIRESKWVNAFISNLPMSKVIFQVYDAINMYRNNMKVIVMATLVTMVLQLSSITSLYLCAKALNFDGLSMLQFYFITPLGLLISGLPISPQGIGVGQATFLSLFNWANGYSSSIGADLSTLSQMLTITLNFCGVFFYVTSKNDVRISDLETAEQTQ